MEIFEISIFLVLFFLVGPSFNHTLAKFKNKKKIKKILNIL